MSNRRSLRRAVQVASVALSLVTAACAGNEDDTGELVAAITAGEPDHEHVNVGAVVAPRAAGGWRHICTGTLVAPDVVLTAGHCTVGASRLGITFAQNIAPGSPIPSSAVVVEGDAVTHPSYNPNGDGAADTHDLGVLLLDEAVDLPASPLPGSRLLSQLRSAGDLTVRTTTVISGFGFADATGLGLGGFTPSDERRKATTNFSGLTTSMIKTTGDLWDGTGSGCFGDSGGPTFLRVNGLELVVGVNVIADGSCESLLFAYRTDTDAARSFLGEFLP